MPRLVSKDSASTEAQRTSSYQLPNNNHSYCYSDLEIVQGLSGNLTVQVKKFLPICVIFDIFKAECIFYFSMDEFKWLNWHINQLRKVKIGLQKEFIAVFK